MPRSAPGSITAEDERRPRRLRAPSPAATPDRIKLLLVDDTPANLIALASILDAPAYELISCGSGAEALQLLRAHEFAVVLADVMMPEMDGYELVRRVPEHDGGRATPVILLTAMATDSRHVQRGLAAGAVDYLPKPLEPEFVKAKVAVFVELHRQRVTLRQQEARLAELERREQERLLAAAEAETRHSHLRYRTLVEATTSIVWSQSPHGAFVEPQPSWEAYTGQRWDDYKDKGWLTALPAEDRDQLAARWAEARIRAERFEVEGRLWHQGTGAYRWFLARGVPILDQQGDVVEWIGTFNDVDDRLRAVEDTRRLNETLEHRVIERTAELRAANRELESFSYSVSHDLRAPLRGIDGFSEILLREHGETVDEPARAHLAKIRAAASRMAQLIDDMLSLSRVTRREMRRDEVRLSELVRQVADELKAREPGRVVTFRIQPDLVCTGDPVLLRAAMENLVGNAWKFTSRHSTALIEFGCRDEEAQRVFYLKDDGAGFKMAYAGKLFGAFQRLHGTHEFPGTGIGLATVQRIIQRHGGRIWAEGQVEQGATFSFVLGRGKETP